jgi:hypothetical protein
MCKAVLDHVVQGVTIGQLGLSQGHELGSIGVQFELGNDELFHERNRSDVHVHVKPEICKSDHPTYVPKQGTPRRAPWGASPCLKGRGLLRRFVDTERARANNVYLIPLLTLLLEHSTLEQI